MRKITAAVVAMMMLSCTALFAADSDMGQQGSSTGTSSTDQMGQQGGATGGASGDQQMSQEKTITATVNNVNTDQKKISITGPEGNKVDYTLNDNTVITTQTGNQIRIGDLKPGSKVTISYTGTRDNPNITKVMVQPGQ